MNLVPFATASPRVGMGFIETSNAQQADHTGRPSDSHQYLLRLEIRRLAVCLGFLYPHRLHEQRRGSASAIHGVHLHGSRALDLPV